MIAQANLCDAYVGCMAYMVATSAPVRRGDEVAERKAAARELAAAFWALNA